VHHHDVGRLHFVGRRRDVDDPPAGPVGDAGLPGEPFGLVVVRR
jgi:hypothetical protein